ncbi:MAG: chitobiase/beta-hexosaminidase C-terminal domain-containing protein [Bacteroidota bacterium]
MNVPGLGLHSIGFRWGLPLLFFLFGAVVSCQSKKKVFLLTDSIQLASPKILADSVLFREMATITLHLEEEDALIKYTLDGSGVDADSQTYSGPIQVYHTATVKAKAFHPAYRTSETQAIAVRKQKGNLSGVEAKLHTEPHVNYPGNGAASLVDGQKGSTNFRNGNHWLGFQKNRITTDLRFPERRNVESIIVSVLQDQGSWIFSPETITITVLGNQIGTLDFKESAQAGEKKMLFLEVPVTTGKYKELTITIEPLSEIPDWHQGKGTKPWVFIDEIWAE